MLFALVLCALTAFAQDNDKILNRQYVDQKKIHFGFSVGTNFQDIHIVNNGFQTEDGETWFADVPQHSPGFCVNVLADLRLAKNFNLRFSPGMYCGNKVVKYINSSAPDEVTDPLRHQIHLHCAAARSEDFGEPLPQCAPLFHWWRDGRVRCG